MDFFFSFFKLPFVLVLTRKYTKSRVYPVILLPESGDATPTSSFTMHLFSRDLFEGKPLNHLSAVRTKYVNGSQLIVVYITVTYSNV